jgi:fluoroacetyl-CoA thioesterase
MKPSLSAGLRHVAELKVTPNMLVPNVAAQLREFSDMPPVFATAMMIGFVEATCVGCLRTHLDAGEHTVGTHVDVKHIAATLGGKRVRAQVELVSVEGRALTFKVEVHDDAGKIGEGLHCRAVISVDRFISKVQSRSLE